MGMVSGSSALLAERERLLSDLARMQERREALANEEKKILRSLAEVKQQIEYYTALEKDMKRSVHPSRVRHMMADLKGE